MQDGEIHCGSRNNDLTLNKNPFSGFVEYVKNHDGMKVLLVHLATWLQNLKFKKTFVP